MEYFILQFGGILMLAALLGLIAKRFNQPTILGFIIAGIVASSFLHGQATEEMLEVLSKLGITFLLFLLGVELNIKEIKEVGPAAIATGVGQVLATASVGFVLARFLFGFEVIEAAYVATALTFSSTIVIVKLLGEKGDLNSLYGRIAVGLLIVQDLIAVLALILLNSLVSTGGGNLPVEIGMIVIMGGLLVSFAFIFGRGLEIVLERAGRSSELLLLFVIAWALVFAYITESVGFSLEVGAFLAGIVLAASPLNVEIIAKVKPLRDFFIIIFFVVLGMGLSLEGITSNIPQILLLSAFVLIGNPIILLSIMGFMGYHRRVSFLAGLTVSQISEFSLIIVSTGVVLGQISDETLSIVTGIAIVTLTVSSYFISHGDKLYEMFAKHLKVFQRSTLKHHNDDIEVAGDRVVVVGAHRMGSRVIKALKESDIQTLVIDYDPTSVKKAASQGVEAVYGDLSDSELLDQLDIPEIKYIVSTVPLYEDNLLLLAKVAEFRNKPKIIVRSENNREAEELYRQGADYVLIPERIAGDTVVDILKKDGLLEKQSP